MVPSRKLAALALTLALLAPPLAAETWTFELDPGATEVRFRLGATLHAVHGTLRAREGRIVLDPRSGEASGRIVLDARSAETGNRRRDEKMHDKILESARHPDIVYTVRRVSGSLQPIGRSTLQLRRWSPPPASPPAAVAPVAAAPAAPAAVSLSDCYRVGSERFVFHSDPWINLHHFLFQWARGQAEPRPGDRRRPIEVVEGAGIGDLAADELPAWERALAYYRERLVAGDLLWDRHLIELRDPLTAIACAEEGGRPVDPELAAALEAAMPVYRSHWWPGHHAANVAWIEAVLEELARYERPFAGRLAAAYGGEWPRERVRVDVTVYANSTKAYTTNRPDLVTLTSTDPLKSGLNGLEMLFHEASHASFFEQRLLAALDTAFEGRGARPPAELSHVIQFVTPAAVLRSVVDRDRLVGFEPYAERAGLYRLIPAWQRAREALEPPWQTFLDGEIERAEALDRIAAAVAQR